MDTAPLLVAGRAPRRRRWLVLVTSAALVGSAGVSLARHWTTTRQQRASEATALYAMPATLALRDGEQRITLSGRWRRGRGRDDALRAEAFRRLDLRAVLFHHSNLRLPQGVDEALAHVVTTPRLHGIHHSQRPDEMDSNWSAGFTWWDRLHGTLRTDVPQEGITIGVDDPLAERDIALLPALEAPFREARETDEFAPS